MTGSVTSGRPVRAAGRVGAGHRLGWRALLTGATVAELLLLALSAAILGDAEALAMAVLCAVGLGLLRFRGGRLGAVALGLLLANVALWMLPGALSNMLHGAGALSLGLLIPSALTAVSVTGVVAAAAVVLRRPRAGDVTAVPRRVVAAAAILLVVLLAGGLLSNRGPAADSTTVVTSANMAFSATELTAPAGRAAVSLTNSDLFWHTFTVDALDVDLWVPVRAERTVAFDAPPGTYEFYCRIPGHKAAGMRGTLTIVPAG